MNKTIINILLICAIAVGFSSCKKYEEGPNISFRSVKQRVTNTWKIESININGLELVNEPQYSTQKQFWLGDGQYNHTYIDPSTGVGKRVDGKWTLQNSNNQISVVYNNITTGKPETTVIYNIIKLYEKCMWIRSTDNSIEYHLIPQN
jgi:hypothetical protein